MLDISDISLEKLDLLKEFVNLFKVKPNVLYDNKFNFILNWLVNDLKAQIPVQRKGNFDDMRLDDDSEMINSDDVRAVTIDTLDAEDIQVHTHQMINIEVTRTSGACSRKTDGGICSSSNPTFLVEKPITGTVKTYGCNICHKKFGSETGLQTHNKNHTDVLDAPNHGYLILEPTETNSTAWDMENKTCRACGLKFDRRRLLKEHALSVHGIKKPFYCLQCDFVTAKYERLRPHMSVHTGEKPYSCTFCPRSFRIKSTADLHILTHTKERPFKCTKCEKSFRHPSTLKKHVTALHDNLKSYICETCGRAFNHVNSFRRHKQNKVCLAKLKE
uniref:C2H2-type domain-containing protein n=1 Tax=Ciona savignyi TaxID=51511 RepID=H2Z1Q9_CIOSA